jgi:hypothetical protein
MNLQHMCIESLHKPGTMLTVHPDYAAVFPDIHVYTNASRYRIDSIEGPFIRIRPVCISFCDLAGIYLTLEYPHPVKLKKIIHEHNAQTRKKYESGEMCTRGRTLNIYRFGYQDWVVGGQLVGSYHLPLDKIICESIRVSHIHSWLGRPVCRRFRLCTRAFSDRINNLTHSATDNDMLRHESTA